MCLNPILIKNPNFHAKSNGVSIANTSSLMIPIPCGHCAECVTTRHLGIIQRCELEELYGHPFVFFLSYMPSMIPRVTTSDGHDIMYFDFKELQATFKRIRNNNAFTRPFRYIVMSERGQKGKPHCHGLIYLQKRDTDSVYTIQNLEKIVHDELLKEWRRNYGSKRSPLYKDLCVPIEYFVAGKRRGTYGCHYVYFDSRDGSTLGAVNYATKYFLKADEFTDNLQKALRLNLPSYEYDKVWNLVRNRYISSRNFGFGLYDYQSKRDSKIERLEKLSRLDTFKYIQSCLSRSVQMDNDFPTYYKLCDGRPVPLSRYFYHVGNLYTQDVYNHFKDKSNQSEFGDYFVSDDRTLSQLDYDRYMKSKQLKNITRITDLTDLF